MPGIKTSNLITPSAIGQWEPHETETETESSVLPNKVNDANQRDDFYTSICAHLGDPAKHAKSKGIKLKGYRVSKSLLMKENQLCVSDNKGLWLKVIKEIHTQPAISYPGIEQTLNMIQRYYH